MAKMLGKLMAPGGKFTNSEGEEKTRWIQCGVVLQTDKGMRVKLECVPVGGAEGGIWFSVFEDQPQQQQQQPKAQNSGFRAADVEQQPDIPF